MSNFEKPLSGVRVLDLSIYVAAPACSAMLGYLGADVIKVESVKGDPYRISGKGYGVPAEAKMNPSFDQCNGFKRGIAVDFRSEEGREVLRRLAKKADIVVTNYREKALKGMNMTYEDVKTLNPAAVYGIFSGYGDRGPDAERPGFDATTFFARSGLALRGSYRGHPPMASISAAGDTISSMALTVGILAAYCKAKETGVGEKVTSSLYGSALWVLGIPIVQAEFGHVGPFPHEAPGFIALSNDYRCKDGVWVRICGMSAERYWGPLCEALEMPEAADDPRFATSAEQHCNLAAACTVVQEHFKNYTYEEIAKRLTDVDLPFERHVTLDGIGSDEQVIANRFQNPVTYENGRVAHMTMPPFKMDSVDDSTGSRGPYLGEQTESVLLECGFTVEEINSMAELGRVVQSK